MIQSFFIIGENGICIYERHYTNSEIDAQIFSGFITALGNFAIDSMGEELQQMKIKHGRLSIVKHSFAPIIAVAIADDKDRGSLLYKILKVTLLEFYDRFYKEIKKEDPGIKAKTREFNPIIDEIIKKRFGIADRSYLSIVIGLAMAIGLSSLIIFMFSLILNWASPGVDIMETFFGPIQINLTDGMDATEFIAVQRIALVVILVLVGVFISIFLAPVFLGSYYAGSTRNGLIVSLAHFGITLLVVIGVGTIELFPEYQVKIIPLFVSFSPMLIALNMVIGYLGGAIKEYRKLWPLESEELSEKLKKEMHIFLQSMDRIGSPKKKEPKDDEMPPNF